MENKPAQNIQDSFLNTARKEKLNITIYLLSGVKLTGRIRSFDKYSVVLETNNQEQLIFKHAISTVVMGRVPHAPFAAHGEGKPTAVTSVPSPVPPPCFRDGRLRRISVALCRIEKIRQARRGSPRPPGCTCVRKDGCARLRRARFSGRARLSGAFAATAAKRSLTANAQAARDAATSVSPGTKAPPIPEFSAEESLDELRTLATSAGAVVVGELLQQRDRPDPATLIGGGKLEEIAGAASFRRMPT